ncbi:MAG: ATP-binding protein [Oceanicaulis sp.]
MSEPHYLEAELNALIQSDTAIWAFIQESSLDGVWYWDLEAPENEWMSPQFWRLFGFDPATKAHKTSEWQDLIFPEDLTTAVENFNLHLADPNHPYDQIVRYRHAQGHTVWVRCRGMAIRNEKGEPVRFIGAHNDLTAVKKAEEEARNADRLKSQFLANMSHEIRTPLNGVLGMAQLLDRTDLDARQRELLRVLLRSGTALMDIISDVLDVSRIEAGMVELIVKPFSPKTLFTSAIGAVQGSATAKGLELDVTLAPGMPDQLVGDEARLRQILLNLLGNAVKFTDTGKISFKARWNDGRLRIDVIDTGCGVPAEMREAIFDRFRQASEGEARRSTGAGLGLSICRDLARLAGGSVALADPQPAIGAHFVLKTPLPLAANTHETLSPSQAAAQWIEKLAGARVLVVDDNPVSRTVLGEFLSTAGATYCEAGDGQAALAAIRSGECFDAVLMDLHMPDLSGLDVLRALRSEERPPVIFITADVSTRTQSELAASEAFCTLKKPVDFSDLTEALFRALDDAQVRAQGRKIA